MAKKKQKKAKEKEKFSFNNEIVGILIILFSIIGIGKFGPAGNFIRGFAIFLVGNLDLLLLLCLFVVGVCLIIKKGPYKIFSNRMIGVYIVVLSILLLFHVRYIEVNNVDKVKILSETFDNLLLSFKSPSNVVNSGGGIIGALFSYLCVSLFGDGTIVVAITLFALGIIISFDISLFDVYNKVVDFISSHRDPKKDDDDNDNNLISTHNEIREDDVSISAIVKDALHEEKTPLENVIDDDIPIIEKPVINSMEIEKPKEEVVINVNENYQLPPITLLKNIKNSSNKENEEQAKANIKNLEQVLSDFDVSAKVVQVNIGPAVTQYELELKTGTKVSNLLSIEREIALALAAKSIKIQAPIPGKKTIGIELPNLKVASVSFREVLTKMPDIDDDNILAVGLGKNIMGKAQFMKINKTPHLLVAGATGSGKSVCMNCIITSILMRTKPDQVKLVMVDPKKVELSMYNGVPHLMCPVVTDPKKASVALKNIVCEMERRYDLFENNKVKNIEGYNHLIEGNPDIPKMPYIVVIIDELADLMLVAKKEVEDSIMRITQMARAAGIHLIVATQRPSTNVITGVVKSNIPSRISFAVSSFVDSRTILDAGGAEKLLGKGDMLFLPMGESNATRIQGAYIDEEDIQKVVDYVCEQQKAQYDESLTEMKNEASNYDDDYESSDEYDDPLFNEVVDFAVSTGKISASLVQRKYRIGYNRAARIIDLLEERGIIGPQNGSKPREVLIKKDSNM